MPSAYTAGVATGKVTTLRDFALSCARGMGALIMMRDEPSDTPIPERFEPSDYHTKALAKATAELNLLNNLTPFALEAEATAYNKAELANWEERKAADALRRKRYQDMLDKVRAWKTKAEGIREFMLDQITESMDFDCPEIADTHPTRGRPKLKNAQEYFAERLKAISWQVEYHAKGQREEAERVEARNQWLKDLRASL